MSAVAKVEDRLPETIPATSMMEFIQRAATDPSVDVGKLEKLMALAERMEARQAERAFDDAMAAAQEEMTPVRTDAANKSTSSRYATFAALDRAIRPTYTKHGFSVSFDTGDAPVPPSCPEISTTSAFAFVTPAAIVPTPALLTSFTLTLALRFAFFKSKINCAKSSIE